MIMGRFATYFRAWHQALFQDFNNTAPAAHSTALPADNSSLSANRYLVFRRRLKEKRGRALRTPPQAQTPHSNIGKGEEPDPQAECSRVFRPGSKTSLMGAQAETTLATTAAPNPVPAIPPLGLKTRPQKRMLLGPRLKIKRIARQFYRQSASHRRRQT